MFVRDGLVYAAMGAIFTAIFGGIGITVIYRMALKIFAVTSNTFTVRFVLQFPWLVFGCGMLVTVICAFMSSYIPYLRDKKQTAKRMNVTKID